MLQLIARKSKNPDVLLNLAQRYLESHEWGRARMVLDQLDTGGSPGYGGLKEELMQDILRRLGSCCSQENKS